MKKNTKKKIYLVSLATTLNTVLCGCSIRLRGDVTDDMSYAYKQVTDVKLVDGDVCQVFNGNNMELYIDSENMISTVYLIYSSRMLKLFAITYMKLDLDGNGVYYSEDGAYLSDAWTDDAIDYDTVIPFYNLDEYVENFEIKEWYTREEIDNIVQQATKTYQKIIELEDNIYN